MKSLTNIIKQEIPYRCQTDLKDLLITSGDMYKAQIVLDLDDMAQDWESNALNWLVDFKREYPNFKVTLFTIIRRWQKDMLKKLTALDFIEFAAHGLTHQNNDEVESWNKEKWVKVLTEYDQMDMFVKIFKAPNWQMTQLGYYMLRDFGWAVACRKNQIEDLPKNMKYYCFETNIFGVHGHTWTIKAHVEEEKFQGWNKNTQFDFVSQHLEEKI
jgi:hypothetical protein